MFRKLKKFIVETSEEYQKLDRECQRAQREAQIRKNTIEEYDSEITPQLEAVVDKLFRTDIKPDPDTPATMCVTVMINVRDLHRSFPQGHSESTLNYLADMIGATVAKDLIFANKIRW